METAILRQAQEALAESIGELDGEIRYLDAEYARVYRDGKTIDPDGYRTHTDEADKRLTDIEGELDNLSENRERLETALSALAEVLEKNY